MTYLKEDAQKVPKTAVNLLQDRISQMTWTIATWEHAHHLGASAATDNSNFEGANETDNPRSKNLNPKSSNPGRGVSTATATKLHNYRRRRRVQSC